MSGFMKFLLLTALILPAVIMCAGAGMVAPTRGAATLAEAGGHMALGGVAGFMLGLAPGIILSGGLLLAHLFVRWAADKAGVGGKRE